MTRTLTSPQRHRQARKNRKWVHAVYRTQYICIQQGKAAAHCGQAGLQAWACIPSMLKVTKGTTAALRTQCKYAKAALFGMKS